MASIISIGYIEIGGAEPKPLNPFFVCKPKIQFDSLLLRVILRQQTLMPTAAAGSRREAMEWNQGG
jgi:hypothetical protein